MITCYHLVHKKKSTSSHLGVLNDKKVGSLISDKYIEKSLERANKGNVRGFFDIKFVSNSDGLMTFEIEIPNTCLNPLGTVQGGMIVSILDETTAYHVNIITNDKLIPNSTDIHVSFHRPLIIGKCFSKTEILKLGKNVVLSFRFMQMLSHVERSLKYPRNVYCRGIFE